ncbi:3-phenylpropionate/cinnamic acid dioxygenase subunit beta [Rhodococcus fascians]|nr:3-phenylpropionate/cinnamic acid dioxygenase subunit beta [Rhodococcus fascians]MBY3826505.1 3-phenylpropionate/cinnamic acid dioxygenase subunit beta [Rhodococcus fascians]MBY3836966.1 3-phenylpropionate/cinnamic acid dioxygenase subunit beta [Rhodococcus fascians]MBY3865567.1 3-phenylpropionate/cinnamic acid dioxygenase subunit beta [Rhodococcus fascians]MBY3885648.1 3-phenylpropionate/cinnamic acid dioxygenase subunit beta [Rhodococcus fascians]
MPQTRSVSREIQWDIQEFLYREALALDERRFRDWLAYLSEDIRYEVPVRVTREALAEWELSPTSRIFDDDMETLEVRVQRLETDFAWAEQPPSRTRHYVTNILVDHTEVSDEYLVSSNCFIYRSRGDDPNPSLYSMFRKDTVRWTEDGWRLARRWAAFDQALINAHNLSIFI